MRNLVKFANTKLSEPIVRLPLVTPLAVLQTVPKQTDK
jgi:hypothetical protein